MPSESRNARSQPIQGKSWFFGIGIDQYKDDQISPLYNAVKDVKDMLRLLQNKYDLQKDVSQTIVLFNEEATRERILTTLRFLVKNVQPEDKLLIYFSGHGHWDEVTDIASWLPHDAQKRNFFGTLSNTTILDYIRPIQARHILIIADSCYSGGLIVNKRMSPDIAQRMEADPSRWALCSGREDEPVSDGEKGKNSPFARLILDFLNFNQKIKINIGTIANKVVTTYESNYRQTPIGGVIYGVGDKGGQYMFQLNEKTAWENAESLNDKDTYWSFSKAYPNSRFAALAIDRAKKLESDELAWEQAENQNSIIAYQKYITAFPQGQHLHKALERFKQLDDKLWEETKKIGEIQDYEHYLKESPRGQFIKEAKEVIEILKQDKTAWVKTQKEDTIDAYGNYLRNMPQGRYRESALKRKKELDEIFWTNTEAKNSIEGYQNYLEQNPHGYFVAEAAKRIAQLERDDLSWEKAEDEDNIMAYQSYIKEFANGQYVNKARKNLNKLDQKNWEEAKKKDEIEAYKLFLAANPSSKFKQEASDRLKFLEEDLTRWEKARKKDTVRAYDNYMQESPDGKFLSEAKEKRRDLKKRQAIKRANRNVRKRTRNAVKAANRKRKAIIEGLKKFVWRYRFGFILLLIAPLVVWAAMWYRNREARPNSLKKKFGEIIQAINDDRPVEALNVQFNASQDTVAISGWVDYEMNRTRIRNVLNSISPYEGVRYFNLEALRLSMPKLQIDQDSARWRLNVAEGAAPYRLEIRRADSLVDSLVFQQSGQHIISIETLQEQPGFYDLSLLDRENKAATPQRIKVAPKDPDRYVEDRDGNYYPVFQLADKIWLAKNLNYDLEGSSCYGDDSANCKTYGRLYAWRAAWDACEKLGDGWRLPTDDEYINLREVYSYNSLVKNGSSGFEALFGGYGLSNGSYDMLGEQGMFWCAKDPSLNSAAWYMRITARSQIFLNKNLGKNARLSCRCVKDLD